MARASSWTALTALALASACVPQAAGYEDVRNVVSRTGHDVRWRAVDAGGRTPEAVEALLSAPLTADSAVKIALLENRELQAAFEALGVARGELQRALRLPNPTLEGGLSFEGGATDIELSLSQDLSELIFLPARGAAQREELAATRLDVAGRALDLIFAVRKAYYDVVADQQILELRGTVLEALKAAAATAAELHAAGNISDLDRANHEVLYEEARVSQSTAETALATSRERLNALLGVWGGATRWSITARLEAPPEVTLESLEGRAIERSVELTALRHRYGAAARRANLARARGLLPELRAGVALEREGGEWSVGPMAELELPLFYQGQGEVTRAEAELRREKELIAATAVRVRAAIRAVQVRARTARERVSYFEDVLLPMRERILSETQLQYNAMNASVFQLLIARRDQIEAGRAYVDAQREYWLAAADLEQLLAGRLPEGALATPASGGGGGGGASAPSEAEH